MLHAPELRVWIDGRANTLYDDKIYNDYVSMTGRGEGMLSRLAQYPADAALLQASSRLANALTGPQLAWRVVYRDAISVVLLPPTSPLLRRPLPDADQVLGPDDPERLLARASAAFEAGRPDEARAKVEAALAVDPSLMRAYGLLAEIEARQGDVAGIAAAIERGLAAEPREYEKLRLLEAAAYEEADRPDLQLRALEAGVQRGPFSRPEAARAQIEALRAKVASR
jgi:tetratricopeptide (TPR) repeat protein